MDASGAGSEKCIERRLTPRNLTVSPPSSFLETRRSFIGLGEGGKPQRSGRSTAAVRSLRGSESAIRNLVSMLNLSIKFPRILKVVKKAKKINDNANQRARIRRERMSNSLEETQ